MQVQTESIEPVYIGVDFPIRAPGFFNEIKWEVYAEVMDAHVSCFAARTGANIGWVYKPEDAHDFYVTVEPSAATKYLREAEWQFPSFRFIAGINPMALMSQYVETEMRGEAA